jgi:hypothetical protein
VAAPGVGAGASLPHAEQRITPGAFLVPHHGQNHTNAARRSPEPATYPHLGQHGIGDM